MSKTFIAHIREIDGVEQSVEEHLIGVSRLARDNASKIGLADSGELLGLLHDLGKYSVDFQNYIKSATGIINQDEDEYIDAHGSRGKIDHSTSGAQFLWKTSSENENDKRIVIKILAICLVSHHSGLIDILAPDGTPVFNNRMEKKLEYTHFNEVINACSISIKERIDNLLLKPEIYTDLATVIKRIKAPKGKAGKTIRRFKLGQLVRMLYSCLIDADRTDTCIFERPHTESVLLNEIKPDWNVLQGRLESKLETFRQNVQSKPIDTVRMKISDKCKMASKRERGIFTLTVPTGGGKTLSSMCFALLHADKHKLDRIIVPVHSP